MSKKSMNCSKKSMNCSMKSITFSMKRLTEPASQHIHGNHITVGIACGSTHMSRGMGRSRCTAQAAGRRCRGCGRSPQSVGAAPRNHIAMRVARERTSCATMCGDRRASPP